MKSILIFLLVFLNLQIHASEKLYVWAKSGLYLRGQPSKEGTKITKIDYGEQVEIIDDFHGRYYHEEQFLSSIKYLEYESTDDDNLKKIEKNSIELNFSGRWILVKYKNFEGFVFGGYLSKFPSFKENKNKSYEYVKEYLKRNFGLIDSISQNDEFDSPYTLIYKTGYLYYNQNNQKGISDEFSFTNMTFNEALLFVKFSYDIIMFDLEDIKQPYQSNEQFYCLESDNKSFAKINFPAPDGLITIRVEGSFTIISVLGSC